MVLDGIGVGALPDADRFGDAGANTLGHLADRLQVPHLRALGLDRLVHFPDGKQVPAKGAFGKMAEKSAGKDTLTGHWEMMGVITETELPLYPQGFPPQLLDEICAPFGRGWLGNKAASGTEIIQELGDRHCQSGDVIIYTSGDSVLQIAAHEDVVPREELYRICEHARSVMQGEHGVGRIIARPFTGKSGQYVRTPYRRDYPIRLGRPVLESLAEAGISAIGIGKIGDLFGGAGLAEAPHTLSNEDGMRRSLEALQRLETGLVFTNLVDFDQQYGHRRDVEGECAALEAFDAFLPEAIGLLKEEDLLIITGDHGNDPTYPGTDHTREYVPLLVGGPRFNGPIDLGVRSTFADIGATLAAYFGVAPPPVGQSFLQQLG